MAVLLLRWVDKKKFAKNQKATDIHEHKHMKNGVKYTQSILNAEVMVKRANLPFLCVYFRVSVWARTLDFQHNLRSVYEIWQCLRIHSLFLWGKPNAVTLILYHVYIIYVSVSVFVCMCRRQIFRKYPMETG